MSWVAVGTMVGTGLLSLNQENQKAKQMKKYNEGQAEITRYSPWTGRAGEIKPYTYDPLSATAGGALQGLGMSQSFGKLGGGSQPTASIGAASEGVLGGTQMASELGQMGQSTMNKYSHLIPQGQQGATPSLYSSMKQSNPFAQNSFQLRPKYL